MPMDKTRYPKDWPSRSRRIRYERADGKCEWPDCAAPDGAYIVRDKFHPEKWRLANEGDLLEGLEPDAIKVVLTVAHLNNDTTDNRDENLMALCQLHHLRLDGKYHATNAAKTRARKKADALASVGQMTLMEDTR